MKNTVLSLFRALVILIARLSSWLVRALVAAGFVVAFALFSVALLCCVPVLFLGATGIVLVALFTRA